MNRQDDLNYFYSLLNEIERKAGGKRVLSRCNGRMKWPNRGVYFFFETGEMREDQKTARVVRVGTHAVSQGSGTTLWGRLRQHRGNLNLGGNHRGSIFRLHLGAAIMESQSLTCGTWGKGRTACSEIRNSEQQIEIMVSQYIGTMPFLCLEADDESTIYSVRKLIERNSIALLSNYDRKDVIDSSSTKWLGRFSGNVCIKRSGLWNVDHIDEHYDQEFLKKMEELVCKMK